MLGLGYIKVRVSTSTVFILQKLATTNEIPRCSSTLSALCCLPDVFASAIVKSFLFL